MAGERPSKYGFHEADSERTVASLGPYERIRRLVRLYDVQGKRKYHQRYDPAFGCTVEQIQRKGGKAAIGRSHNYLSR